MAELMDLISDFTLAEHLSFGLDKGQVQDEVRGDAQCRVVLWVDAPYHKLRLGL